MILTWVHMGNLYSHMHHVKYFFLQNSKKFQKISGENIKKILKNYKNFEFFFNVGAYGEMILTWVHLGNLYSHMHNVKFISPYAPMLNIFFYKIIKNFKKFPGKILKKY